MKITCPECGFSFETKDCVASCPLPFKEGCHMVCCPNCGQRTVRESPTVGFLKRLWKATVSHHGQ